jgi:hypothetical protein
VLTIAILLDYLTSEVALEEPEIGTADPNIPIDNNWSDDELQFRIPGGCKDYVYEGDEIDKSAAIPTASRRRRAATEYKIAELGTGNGDMYEDDTGDDADPDTGEESSQAADGSTQTLDD